MRTIRMLLAGLAGALAVLVLSPAPSYACSCAHADNAAFVDFADVVMVGTIEDRVPGRPGTATYLVAVDEVLKGEARPLEPVLSPDSGASCGLENIRLGERYVVFAAYRDVMGAETDELWSTLCGGTAPATQAFVSDVQALTGAGGPPTGGPAYESDLTLTFDKPGRPLAGDWGAPLALAGGAGLVLLTSALWLRFARA